MTSSSKLDNTKIINHFHRLTVTKVAVDNTKQLTLIFGETGVKARFSLLKRTKYALLEGFLNRLFKDNNALIKVSLLNILKGSTSTAGFKKMLYNRIKIQNNRLYPSYNRRKHNHSHYILITTQLGKLSKTLHYLSKNKLKNFITLALKKALGNKEQNTTKIAYRPVGFNSFGIRTRAIPNLISILETQTGTLLWRNQFKHCLAYSRQTLLHGNVQMLLKNNTALILTKK